ncbi:MAG: hypothetical protein RMX96_17850 [Nostoc sp. ChiSLP02]|nr:hypothetical protein [Nostoc sp. DedSLP05]MDZ8097565.1 hypothetical protein [Nostoc sp. DedSLP01]MDZ8186700.1 hypothetical protein [Nostoc sp. ChiSLP02]
MANRIRSYTGVRVASRREVRQRGLMENQSFETHVRPWRSRRVGGFCLYRRGF